jgi:hypothetical protein
MSRSRRRRLASSLRTAASPSRWSSSATCAHAVLVSVGPGRDADRRAAARGGTAAPGWLPWLASCVTRTCGSCAVMSSPASRSIAVAGRSAARQVPVEQLRDQGRLPGLHPDRGRIARAGQARPQPGLTAARIARQPACARRCSTRAEQRATCGRQIVTDVFGVPSTSINDRRRTSS